LCSWRFPFTDLSGHKRRPALIVSRPSGHDLIVAFIASQVASIDVRDECPLRSVDPEFAATGLKTASLVRLNKLATLDRSLVRRRLGRAGARTQQAVNDCLRYVFDL
jgi:mRNA interferase MazF